MMALPSNLQWPCVPTSNALPSHFPCPLTSSGDGGAHPVLREGLGLPRLRVVGALRHLVAGVDTHHRAACRGVAGRACLGGCCMSQASGCWGSQPPAALRLVAGCVPRLLDHMATADPREPGRRAIGFAGSSAGASQACTCGVAGIPRRTQGTCRLRAQPESRQRTPTPQSNRQQRIVRSANARSRQARVS